MKKREIRSFLIHDLTPYLEDPDWLLYDDTILMRIQDETILGVVFDRREVGKSFWVKVHIRPLYWPVPFYALGLTCRIEAWMRGVVCDIETDQSRAASRTTIASVLDGQVSLFFRTLTDGAAILRVWDEELTRPWWPPWRPRRFGAPHWNRRDYLLGYVAAWSGRAARARELLEREREKMASHPLEGVREQVPHLDRVLELLDSPKELQPFLQTTSARIRTLLRLEKARPVTELLDRRNGR